MGVEANTELLSLIGRVQSAAGASGSSAGTGSFNIGDVNLIEAQRWFDQLGSGDGEQQAQAVNGILGKVVSLVANKVADAKSTDAKNQKAVEDVAKKEQAAEAALNERINTFNTDYEEVTAELDGLISNLDDGTKQTQKLVKQVEKLKEKISDKQQKLEEKQQKLEAAKTPEDKQEIIDDMNKILDDMQEYSGRLSSISESIKSVQTQQQDTQSQAGDTQQKQADVAAQGEAGVTEASENLTATVQGAAGAAADNVTEGAQGVSDTATGEALIAAGTEASATGAFTFGLGSVAGQELIQKGQQLVTAGGIETTGAAANQAALGVPLGKISGDALPALTNFATSIGTQALAFDETFTGQFDLLNNALITSIGSFENVGSTGEAISSAAEEDKKVLSDAAQGSGEADDDSEEGDALQLQSSDVETDDLDKVEIEE